MSLSAASWPCSPKAKGTGSSWRANSGKGGRSSLAKGRSTRCSPGCGATAWSRRRGASRPPALRAATTTSRGRRTRPRQLQETMAGFPRRRRRDPCGREPGVTSRQSVGEADKLVRRYLAQLDAALQGVDASRREEILADVHEHIEEGRDRARSRRRRECPDPAGQGRRPHCHRRRGRRTAPGHRRWDAWAPWLIIFGPIASGLGWIAGVLILWTSPTWSQRDKLIATFVPLAGLVALFFGLVAALHAAAGCPGHAAGLHDQRGHLSRSESPSCWSSSVSPPTCCRRST